MAIDNFFERQILLVQLFLEYFKTLLDLDSLYFTIDLVVDKFADYSDLNLLHAHLFLELE